MELSVFAKVTPAAAAAAMVWMPWAQHHRCLPGGGRAALFLLPNSISVKLSIDCRWW